MIEHIYARERLLALLEDLVTLEINLEHNREALRVLRELRAHVIELATMLRRIPVEPD